MEITSWEKLYRKAQDALLGEKFLTPLMKGGYVSAALLTNKGNIYTAVNIDCRCALGYCAERFAAYKVFEANKNEKIVRLVCLYRDKGPTLPCGACREFLMQFDKDAGNIEILLDLKTHKTIKLSDTMPYYWGQSKYQNATV